MKAQILKGIRRMEMTDLPDPVIKKGSDVIIRMKSVGICGSDVHYYRTGRIGNQVIQYPFVLGHEGAGVVFETGSEVSLVSPGDRVAVEPAVACGECDQCRAGRSNTCRNMNFLSCPGQLEGCISEYLLMPQENCLPISDDLSFERAAFAEPLSIGIYAVKRVSPLKDARVGILGCGPIGLCILAPAVLEGAERIYVTDKLNYRLESAKALGAIWASNPEEIDIVGEVGELEPMGLDIVFECCGDQEALNQAVSLLKPGGVLVIVGIPKVERIFFDIDSLRVKELAILNIRRQEGCMEPALRMLEQGRFDVSSLITHAFSFERTKEAFDLVSDYGDRVIKAVIDFP